MVYHADMELTPDLQNRALEIEWKWNDGFGATYRRGEAGTSTIAGPRWACHRRCRGSRGLDGRARVAGGEDFGLTHLRVLEGM